MSVFNDRSRKLALMSSLSPPPFSLLRQTAKKGRNSSREAKLFSSLPKEFVCYVDTVMHSTSLLKIYRL